MLLQLSELKILYLEKLIDKMKFLKNVMVFSDGSILFFEKTFKNTDVVNFHIKDDKNFNFYQKVKKFNNNSKYLQLYKKKYFK